MCCTRLAGNTGRKNHQKFATWAPSHNFVGLYHRNQGMYRQSEKRAKQQYLLHMSSQYGELRSNNGLDRFGCLGHPSKFQGVSHLAFVTAATSLTGVQPNVARCLEVSWAGILYIHFRGLSPPDGILPGAKFTLCLSLAFSYIGSVTVRHSSSGRQKNCSVVSSRDRAAIQFYIGRSNCLVMAALCNRGPLYFALWFVFSSFFLT